MKNLEELTQIEDKLSLITNRERLLQYAETTQDYLDVFSMLNDDEKFEVLRSDFFKKQGYFLKRLALGAIKDEKIKSKLLKNGYIKTIVDDSILYEQMLISLSYEKQLELLQDGTTIEQLGLSSYKITGIVKKMSPEHISHLMSNPELIEKIGIDKYSVPGLLSKIEDDKLKEETMAKYDLTASEKTNILTSFSYKYKTYYLATTPDLNKNDIIRIIGSFKKDDLAIFLQSNQDFMKEKNIRTFDIVRKLNSEQQLEFINNMPQLNLDEKETRMIIAGLSNETKEKIDPSSIESSLRPLLNLKLENWNGDIRKMNQIIPDLDGDLEVYKDLDELLYTAPLTLGDQDKQKLLELAKMCPNMIICDNLAIGSSTGKEFIEGEQWIASVIEKINPEWTDVQKMAFIDTEVGKKISYSPNFGTEVEDPGDERALWKIISSGYGVCNGIAQVEQYLFSKVGIQSDLTTSGVHAFLKVNGIEIPTKDGIKKGDTLVDPTWNLAASRYGGKPQHFCNGYDEIRKADIDSNGKDHNCHKNEELEHADLIHMDEESLREIYSSIGIADKDGQFPIAELLDEIEQLNNAQISTKENIIKRMELLKKACPEYTQCINSTQNILSKAVFTRSNNFDYDRCVVSRVYDKSDPNKSPVLYTYFDSPDEGEMFFYADKQSGDFKQLPKEYFQQKFDCYDMDKEKNGGLMTWEYELEEEDLTRSSGNIEATKEIKSEELEL